MDPNKLIELLIIYLPYEIAIKIVYKYKGYQTPTGKIMGTIINHIYKETINNYKDK